MTAGRRKIAIPQAYYMERLEEALGTLDPREFEPAWDLCWLKVFAQLGFCLVDSLVGTHTAQELCPRAGAVRQAIDRAKRIADAHAG